MPPPSKRPRKQRPGAVSAPAKPPASAKRPKGRPGHPPIPSPPRLWPADLLPGLGLPGPRDEAPLPPPRRDLDAELLANIHAALPELEGLLAWPMLAGAREDAMYRLYHQSYKVYALQPLTLRIVGALERLAPPGTGLSPWFREIVAEGTGHEFTLAHNQTWPWHARRIVEAFLHAHFFLETAARYGRMYATAPSSMPGGWAAVLELYGAM